MQKTEFIGAGRGSSDGTIIIIPEVRKNGRIVEREKVLVRVRRHGREKKRLAENRTHAKGLRRDLIDEFRREQLKAIGPRAGKTFKELADFYQKEYMHAPDRHGNGLKSWKKLRHPLKVLRAEFDEEPLSAIDYERIDEFRKKFAATKTVKKKERSLASVDRVLALLRRMLNIARHRKTWGFSAEPFRQGDTLIRTSKEKKRMRILTHAEEKDLLAAVKTLAGRGKSNDRHYKNLYPALVFAIDTAARAGEQFGTRVCDVDLVNSYIRVREKSENVDQERIVPITDRLRKELVKLEPVRLHLRGKSMRHVEELIFDFRGPKRSFEGACKKAGITNFRWHDLRHTGTMRMLEAGVDPATAMKVTGHTQWTTFLRYVNLNAELMRNVASKLDQSRSKKKRKRVA